MPRTPSNPTVKHIKSSKFDLVAHNDAADRAQTFPLYTVATHIRQNPALEAEAEIKLVKNLQKYFRGNSETVKLVPYAQDAVRMFNYLFDATRAAGTVAIPVKGFELLPVVLTTDTPRGKKVILAIEHISQIVTWAMDNGQFKARKSSVPWFGNDHADEYEARLAKDAGGKRKRVAAKTK